MIKNILAGIGAYCVIAFVVSYIEVRIERHKKNNNSWV